MGNYWMEGGGVNRGVATATTMLKTTSMFMTHTQQQSSSQLRQTYAQTMTHTHTHRQETYSSTHTLSMCSCVKCLSVWVFVCACLYDNVRVCVRVDPLYFRILIQRLHRHTHSQQLFIWTHRRYFYNSHLSFSLSHTHSISLPFCPLWIC